MSQIEHNFRQFLGKHPEIEKSYCLGLINRRALARFLIKRGIGKNNEFEAIVAMLRRYTFENHEIIEKNFFSDIRVNFKDKILIIDLEKSKQSLIEIEKIIKQVDYDKGDTLKVVVGSSSIKLYIDEKKKKEIKQLLEGFKNKEMHNMVEISLMFPDSSVRSKGVISALTRELALNNVLLIEILTSSPELILYLEDKYLLKALEVIKDLQRGVK